MIMNKRSYIIFITLFFLILIVPLILSERGKNVASKIDNRMLKDYPDSLSEADFYKKFEAALNDRIGLRSQMITTYTVLNDWVFDYMVHPGYTYGKEGYVFFKYGGLDQQISEFHFDFASMVLKLQNYCVERGIKFYFMFEPEKKYVYERYFAPGVKYSKDYWVKDFIHCLDSLGVNYIDNSDFLKEKSFTEQVYNRQYDAGHWNDLGAFYCFNRLFERMHADFPNVRLLTFDDFDITEDIATTLPVSYFPIADPIKKFKLKTEFIDSTKFYRDDISLNVNFPYFHYRFNIDSVNLPKILTFQGSYFNRNSFMIANAKTEIAIHNYQNILDFDKYVNMFHPDAVVFEVAEYVFGNGYFNQERMKNLKFNPSLHQESFTDRNYTIDYKQLGNTIAFVCPNQNNAEYVWLQLDNKVYDCKLIDGYYSTDLIQIINESGNIFVQYSDGTKSKFIAVQSQVNLERVDISGGVVVTDSNYVFTTDVANNSFSYLGIQLHNPRNDSYKLIDYKSELGCFSGFYINDDETGDYYINLRGNTNLSDELIQYKVHLEKGNIYTYEFTIDSLSSKKIIAKDFQFK